MPSHVVNEKRRKKADLRLCVFKTSDKSQHNTKYHMSDLTDLQIEITKGWPEGRLIKFHPVDHMTCLTVHVGVANHWVQITHIVFENYCTNSAK